MVDIFISEFVCIGVLFVCYDGFLSGWCVRVNSKRRCSWFSNVSWSNCVDWKSGEKFCYYVCFWKKSIN